MKKQNIVSSLLGVLVSLSFAFTVGGCKGKSTSSDQAIDGATMGGAGIDSSPLNFDASGSDSGKIAGLVTVRFGYDKATLDSSSKAEIAQNAEWMKKNSEYNVQIEGHCDARGTIEYNVALGERRASAVKAYLVSLGIKESRISTISYGKEKPLMNEESEEAYAKNRRANFVPVK